MAANKTDLIQKVGLPGSATTLAGSGYTIGDTGITVATTTNWPTDTGVSFAIDTVEIINGVESRVDGSYCEFVGVVTGASTIGTIELTYGTPQNYPAGATTRVYIPVSSTRENRLAQAMLVEHKQDGTHGALTATSVTATSGITVSGGVVTLPNGAIDGNELSASAITLGYTQITSSFTTTSTNAVQVTGLTLTVTIPAGGRRVKITAYSYDVANNVAGGSSRVTIWDGTVGAGTQLQQCDVTSSSANFGWAVNCVAIVTPAAGSKTYNIGFHTAGNTSSLNAMLTAPAFILVELI
jgi:hypothetical protein